MTACLKQLVGGADKPSAVAAFVRNYITCEQRVLRVEEHKFAHNITSIRSFTLSEEGG